MTRLYNPRNQNWTMKQTRSGRDYGSNFCSKQVTFTTEINQIIPPYTSMFSPERALRFKIPKTLLASLSSSTTTTTTTTSYPPVKLLNMPSYPTSDILVQLLSYAEFVLHIMKIKFTSEWIIRRFVISYYDCSNEAATAIFMNQLITDYRMAGSFARSLHNIERINVFNNNNN